MVTPEREEVRRMMKMFRTDLAVVISGGGRPPVTVEDCVGRAIRAEYWVNQNREERAKFFQAKKEERAKGKQNPETQSKGPNSNPGQGNKQQGQGQNKRKGNFNPGNQKGQPQKKNNAGQVNNSFPTCNKCGKKHPGECRAGTNVCYTCGKEGHFSKDCYSNPQNRANQNQQRVQNQPRAPGNQLHAIQATIDGPQISQGRLEAPEPQARIYAYTRGDAATGTSTVVTGQLPVANYDAYALFDSGATHSFMSSKVAKHLDSTKDRINQPFRTALPSGEILLSNYWLRNVPIIICGRTLYVNLIIISMNDYNVILGMDFLRKYNAVIDYRS